uniref:NADH:ubiquinone reductase (H(+)-translocating) n=1 Tax=Obelia longissima TaxID=32570 RepID=G9ISW5_OBELO|nr:NADH dehydrogenase subunit 2 [Obelia longissima]
MNINFINVSIIIGLILIIWDFKIKKTNLSYILILLVLSILILNINLASTYLFDLGIWKLLFLALITFCLLILFELIINKTFDIYCLLLLSYFGSIILIISDNLLTTYLGLELQTFSIFILIAKNRSSIKSSEAGLKYFMLGAISSGFYLLSVVILFLFGYTLELKDLVFFSSDLVVYLSITLILLSFSFKLSLTPFHFWVPDIYEGSSWDVITLIATLPKISVICVFLQILLNSNLVLFLSLSSIIIGTLGALNQTKLKRLLAYSGISQMGFIILAYSTNSNSSITIGTLYVLIYIFINISLFILIINYNKESNFIIELGSLNFINKILSITMVLIILSVAGIPPLSGFINKWYLIWCTIENHYIFSSLIIILCSTIGLGYYLRLVKTIYFQKRGSYFFWVNILVKDTNQDNGLLYGMLGFLFFINLFLIFNFTFLINIITYLFMNIY